MSARITYHIGSITISGFLSCNPKRRTPPSHARFVSPQGLGASPKKFLIAKNVIFAITFKA